VVGRAERNEKLCRHCFDPDAPTGGGFWHWLVVNIAATVRELPLDAGKSRQASRGCAADADGFGDHRLFRSVSAAERPPHRYVFTVFAVSQKTLAVTADSSAALVGFKLNFNTLVKATLMACSSAGACVISTASPRWTRTYQHRRSGVSSPTSRTSRQAARCDTA
jgi:Raf kinase inhibitor-like YbhB/YbcL family protein